MRFPTFTRSIPRPKPPKAPAGLDSCREETLARWRADRFRFPPCTYAKEFMIRDAQGTMRTLSASERELLMGFERDHTLALAKKIPETERDREVFEDLRRSALGNSFRTILVASLLDHVLWSFGVKPLVGHHEIIEAWAEELKRTARLPRGRLNSRWIRILQGKTLASTVRPRRFRAIAWSR